MDAGPWARGAAAVRTGLKRAGRADRRGRLEHQGPDVQVRIPPEESSPLTGLELRGRSDLDELDVQHEPLGVGAAPPLVLLPRRGPSTGLPWLHRRLAAVIVMLSRFGHVQTTFLLKKSVVLSERQRCATAARPQAGRRRRTKLCGRSSSVTARGTGPRWRNASAPPARPLRSGEKPNPVWFRAEKSRLTAVKKPTSGCRTRWSTIRPSTEAEEQQRKGSPE